MKKLSVLVMLGIAMSLMSTSVFADNNGQKIGQDPLRLALTKCSNAGLGNGGEFEAAILVFDEQTESWLALSVYSECLEKEFLSEYTEEEVWAILAQTDQCDTYGLLVVCEIDPGNSASHNANNYK